MANGKYDYVIVGAGTAGCVLANRLSADPTISVLLVEAGMDLIPGREPKSIRSPFPVSYGDPRFGWKNLIAEVGADFDDGNPVSTRLYMQGRLMGGSSSINGMVAQRGLPSDFDEWERLGAAGWNWAGVLPYFNRLETDWDFEGPLHGNTGPIPIRRDPRTSWPPFVRAVSEQMEAEGHPFNPDFNGFFGDCLSAMPMSNTPTQRVSAAMGYLNEEVRQRPNLTIVTDTLVGRVVIEQGQATAVEAHAGSGPVLYFGSEILICAGAIHSPALLMRSGIGPVEHLRHAGIEVAVDRPGVGQNLFNHAIAYIAVHLPRASKQDKSLTSWGFSVLRYSSGHPDGKAGDMQIFPVNRTSWHPLGRRIGALGVCMYKPYSTGTIEVRSSDPNDEPIVKFRLLSDRRDFDRMVDGLSKAARILGSPRVRAVTNESFLPLDGQDNALNQPTLLNWLKSTVINALFELSSSLRRALLARAFVDLDGLASDRKACEDVVRRAGGAVHHGSGTCRMGRDNDPKAVVDPSCRVYGVRQLRVIDASIMPIVVSANTHLAALMIGEKGAQLILDERNT